MALDAILAALPRLAVLSQFHRTSWLISPAPPPPFFPTPCHSSTAPPPPPLLPVPTPSLAWLTAATALAPSVALIFSSARRACRFALELPLFAVPPAYPATVPPTTRLAAGAFVPAFVGAIRAPPPAVANAPATAATTAAAASAEGACSLALRGPLWRAHMVLGATPGMLGEVESAVRRALQATAKVGGGGGAGMWASDALWRVCRELQDWFAAD